MPDLYRAQTGNISSLLALHTQKTELLTPSELGTFVLIR
jgi:hypothetical protein